MYEASFGLKRRPFAATPDATCFLSAGPIQAALDEIVVCIEQGQGISVLTAPAGIGKTLLCEKLVSELGTRFQTVFLRHSSFLTRRALLQTLLCELNRAYHHPSEQELRLELHPAIREVRPEKEALVVICDEAHHLTESLIEELRILADFAESGRPLVRLVLVGQLALEEKLTQPSLEAFNQRIRAHVNLPTFDRAGSFDYIDYRLTWGGGRTDEIFTPAALEVIARASDGIPRCINQLADHSLLLGYVAEQRPVGEEIVLEALNDLRQLPLQWNESSISRSFDSAPDLVDGLDDFSDSAPLSTKSPREVADARVESSAQGHTYSYEPGLPTSESPDSLAEASAVEAGAEYVDDLVDETVAIAPATEIDDVTFEYSETVTEIKTVHEVKINAASDDWRQTLDLFKPLQSEVKIADSISAKVNALPQTVAIPSTLPMSDFHEEVIIDRYASIDAGLPPVESPAVEFPRVESAAAVMMSADTAAAEQVRAIPSAVDSSAESIASDETHLDDDFAAEFDVNIKYTRRPDAAERETEAEQLEQVLGVVRELIDVVSEETGESRLASDQQITQQDNVAARIDCPHEISGPAGTTVPEHESLLKSLRRNSSDAAVSAAETFLRPTSTSTNQSVWESVETTPVETVENPRPFRYLFSMLRRKQQQTN